MNRDIGQEIEIYSLFTHTYKKFYSNPGLREIECMRVQYPLWLQPVGLDNKFAGKGEFNIAIGYSPQQFKKFEFFLDEEIAEKILSNETITQSQKEIFSELVEFWKTEETAYKTRNACSEVVNSVLSSDNWQTEPGIAFPLYRIAGTQIDFDKLLQKGIKGLINEIDAFKKFNTSNESQSLYLNMQIALNLITEICFYYSRMINSITDNISDERITELFHLREILEKIAWNKPETLHEAIQLSFLYCQISGSLNFGRMDEYLGDYLVNDIKKGILTEESAIELIGEYWKTIASRNRFYDSRLTIGGKGRRNEENANYFALLAMDAMQKVKTLVPQMTLRFYEGQDNRLMEKALDTIGAGTTFPMLYNDDINIPAVQKAFNIPVEEAENYIPYGCGEYTIYHKSLGTPSGVINLMQALLVTLYNGIDPKTGNNMGLALGNPESFKTFDQLFDAYKKQVEYHVEKLAIQEAIEYKIAANVSPHLLFSILYDDCLARGKPLLEGGVRYLGGTLESYGNTNVSDSLLVIKELVYERKIMSLEKLVNILASDFEGFEKERSLMLKVPKYGNDNDLADDMKVEVDRHICTVTKEMGSKVGLHTYLVVIINNDANTIMGRQTSASPDGRKAWTFLANGNTPTGGQDKNGITSMLNSIVKPDVSIHAGATQNMKFSKAMFTTYRQQLKSLLNTYFEIGGAQAMLTVVDRKDLENAIREPEKYQNLIVRVGGFSARFVDLAADIQQEILSRTLY